MMLRTAIRAVIAALIALAALVAFTTPARAETLSLTIETLGPYYWGTGGGANLVLRYRNDGCALRAPGVFEALVDGIPAQILDLGNRNSCVDGVGTRVVYAYGGYLVGVLGLGRHTLTARYLGSPGFVPAEATTHIDVLPHYTFAAPGGLGPVSLGLIDASSVCPAQSRGLGISPMPAELPRPLQFPFGVVNFHLTCYVDCGGFAAACLAPNPFPPSQRVQIEYPSALPPGSSIWVLASTNGEGDAAWKELPAKIEGSRATFYLTGPRVRLQDAWPHVFAGMVGVAVPFESSIPKVMDMWWGGPKENGWGLSITQDGDRLFVTLLVYDEIGDAAFYVLHDGSWNSSRTTFAGTLYRPNSRSMGQPVGSLQLLFSDPERPLLRYSLASGEGVKPIQRMEFGAATSQNDSQAGIWDLTLAGTGAMNIHKRGDALFMTWLDFPDSGPGRWMVAPAGQWTGADTYEAALYLPTSSAWAVGYDASRLSIKPVGSLKVRFTGASEGEVTYTIDGVTQTSPLRRHAF